MACMLNHQGGIGHLGQQVGWHKGGDFDFFQARRDQGIDPAQFVCGRHGLLDRLQAIARANFTDQYTVWRHVVFEVWQ